MDNSRRVKSFMSVWLYMWAGAALMLLQLRSTRAVFEGSGRPELFLQLARATADYAGIRATIGFRIVFLPACTK